MISTSVPPDFPPDEHELDQLDEFLRTQSDKDALLLDGVHGFLTALAIGPNPALPAEWLPQVLDEPYVDAGNSDRMLALLSRLNDSIAGDVASDTYAPILGEVSVDEVAGRISAAGWCEGFSRGIDLRAALWESRMEEDPELMEMLGPIMALGLEEGVFQAEGEVERLSTSDYHDCLHQIPMAVAALRHYWRVHPLSTLERRAMNTPFVVDTGDSHGHTLH